MRQVIILGGGFAGVSAALKLKKILVHTDINITLIDRNSYHLLTPSLYEVATSEEPKKNIVIPYSQIFENNIKIVEGKVENIDTKNRLVHLFGKANYAYDFLIIALGSEPSYFDIEGLKKYSIPLKWLEDGVKIRSAIEVSYHTKAHSGKTINVVVGGGGFSGTEFCAELVNYRKHLSIHHKLAEDLVKITLIQGSDSLLTELDVKVSAIAQKRLEKEKVRLCFGAHIKKVDEGNVVTEDNKKYPYDVLIWTGGVRASSVLTQSGFKTNGRGQVSINDKMQVIGFNNIFAIGDVAEFADPATNKPAPGVVEVAEDEGGVAAENIKRLIKNEQLTTYSYLHVGYIIPLKGKFSVIDFKKFRIVGFWGWVLQQFVFLYYLLRILPISKALRRFNKFEMYLMRSA